MVEWAAPAGPGVWTYPFGVKRDRRSTPKRYDGKVAVVTGASSGIGHRLALDLAARGATVVGLARRQDLLAELEKALQVIDAIQLHPGL